jgi:hypothetical protein
MAADCSLILDPALTMTGGRRQMMKSILPLTTEILLSSMAYRFKPQQFSFLYNTLPLVRLELEREMPFSQGRTSIFILGTFQVHCGAISRHQHQLRA